MAESNFVDYVKVHCTSGNGGKGSSHFHRDKKNPRGGPDGGDGGRGGHIIIRGNKQLWTLIHLKYRKHIKAGHGTSGSGNRRTGAEGRDEFIEVPPGTVARNPDSGVILFEIENDGEERILFEGGMGGLGNDHFKTPTNRAPRYSQPGIPGKEGWVVFELKLLGDVGLVGFPNAGKSTLLSVCSAAKPEIADYPFTTLVPNLGIVSYHGDKSFVMADIPGIIEGAHAGKGLGHRFLRHIERNSILLFIVPSDSKNIIREYDILISELEKYNPALLDKGRVLGISKCELPGEELLEEIMKEVPSNIPVIAFSSVTGFNLGPLKDLLWKGLNK